MTAGPWYPLFLSTLSLRRATRQCRVLIFGDLDFYPRSPCGERHGGRFLPKRGHRFLSTLSLRRATVLVCPPSVQPDYFYPRSPCGERLLVLGTWDSYGTISIHALLAESDGSFCPADSCGWHFYPRSPCGERHQSGYFWREFFRFLSTLSLRRATRGRERPSKARYLFLSTLSLRRATDDGRDSLIERMISIHALLAESDVSGNYNQTVNGISIHALLAESDFPTVSSLPRAASFLSTLSLRRATYDLHGLKMGYCISIHALLAESDVLEEDFPVDSVTISIHALLAESDQAGIADVTQRLISIHALLAESDVGDTPPCCGCMISIHALLAESDLPSIATYQGA